MKSIVTPSEVPVSKVVRVAVNNNFNCSEAEFRQLDEFYKSYPDCFFFVNSNIKTPKLLNLNKHQYPAVITVNPDLTVDTKLVHRLHKINNVAFARVKWMPEYKEIDELIRDLDKGYSVVITVQRFNGLKGLLKYSSRNYYDFSYNRFRINDKAKLLLDKTTRGLSHTYICDKAGLGCLGCGLCSRLTIGSIKPIYSLNLSTSDPCKFNCESCYAKTMRHFIDACGYQPTLDKIMKNSKQMGRTQHIKDSRKELAHELV